jgi:metallophosphoesterase superfamily enzyme
MIRSEVQSGVWLDSRRAVFFERLRLLVVSDLHWGYAESHRLEGNLLPDWGDEVIARNLNGLVADYRPVEMLWLGDSLHTVKGRLHAESFLETVSVPVIIIPGNHDARWKAASGDRTVVRGKFVFHHGDTSLTGVPDDAAEIIGHHHPAFTWRDGAGARLKVPALVWSAKRLILPAFSPWAAGVSWNPKLREGEKMWVIGAQRLFAVTPDQLRGVRGG